MGELEYAVKKLLEEGVTSQEIEGAFEKIKEEIIEVDINKSFNDDDE